MKQQDLLRKQADMMDMAEKYGISDWRQLVRVRNKEACDWCEYIHSSFNLSWWGCHKFALGVVEGKPVFEGDTLYAGELQHVIVEATDGGDILQFNDSSGSTWSSHISNWSWNPPKPKTVWSWLPTKPKTVMVELPFEAIENAARWDSGYGWTHDTIGEACRKALEGMK